MSDKLQDSGRLTQGKALPVFTSYAGQKGTIIQSADLQYYIQSAFSFSCFRHENSQGEGVGGGRRWRHYNLIMGHFMDFVQRKRSHTTYIIFNSKAVIQNT